MTAATDPPVRSVRVAIALAERFLDLLSGPTTGDPQSMSIRIGEAQQLYPEIWGHLDDARKTFAGRGVDTREYDEIRSQEQGILGVTDMNLVVVGYGRNEHQVRTAEFNTAGYQRARAAASALMRATPDVDWAAIARQEDAEAAQIGTLTSQKWVALAIAIAGLALLLYLLVRK